MPIWRLVHGASGCPAPSGTMSHQPIIICNVLSILWIIKGKGKSGLQCSSSALDARDPGWSRWDLRSNTVWEGTQISTLGHFFSGNFSFPYPGKSKISFEFGGFHWKCVPNTPIPSYPELGVNNFFNLAIYSFADITFLVSIVLMRDHDQSF